MRTSASHNADSWNTTNLQQHSTDTSIRPYPAEILLPYARKVATPSMAESPGATHGPGRPYPYLVCLYVIYRLFAGSAVFAQDYQALGCTGDRMELSCSKPPLTCRITDLSAKYFHPASSICPNSSRQQECATNASDVIYNCENEEKCGFYVRQERQKGDCVNMSQYIDVSYSCHCSVPSISCPLSNYPMKSFGMLCYELVPEVRSYNDSVKVCNSKNGKLADVTSHGILQFLRDFLDQQYMYGYQWVGNASNILRNGDKGHCYELTKNHGSTWNVSMTSCDFRVRNQFICQYGPVILSSSTTLEPSLTVTSVTANSSTSAPWIHIDGVVAMIIAIGVSVLLFIILMIVICCLRFKDAKRFGSSNANGRARQCDMELKICGSSNGPVAHNGVDNLAFEQSDVQEYAKVEKIRKPQPQLGPHEYDDVCEDDDSQSGACGEPPVAPPPRDHVIHTNPSVTVPSNRRHQYENIFVPNITNSLERKFQNVKFRHKNNSHKNIKSNNTELEVPAVPPHASPMNTNEALAENVIYSNVDTERNPEANCDEFYYTDEVYNPEDTLGRAQNVDEEGGPTEPSDFIDTGNTLDISDDVTNAYSDSARNTFSDEHDSFEDERKHNPYLFSPIPADKVMVENDMYNSAEILNITDADLGTI